MDAWEDAGVVCLADLGEFLPEATPMPACARSEGCARGVSASVKEISRVCASSGLVQDHTGKRAS